MSRIAPTLPLGLYRLATGLLEPLAPGVLKRRAERGKEDPSRLAERLGRATPPRPPGPLAWLHGVSVGESLSLLPLVTALRARRPDLNLLVTSGTATSAKLLAERLPAGVIHQFAPVDTPGAVARFLDHWRPGAGVLVESELWPNLLRASRARGVRLALLSARITEASARRWARWPGSARSLLSAFDLIMPQDSATAQRLAALGGRVGDALNLKLVGAPLSWDEAALAHLAAAAAGRKVVLAASTHPGDELLIAQAVRKAAPDASPLLVIAPRHPARADEIGREMAGGGWTIARRSLGQSIGPETDTYLADTLGELGLFYALADVVVMGGAFPPSVGGHNPLEAARIGKAVLTGPEAYNAAEIYEDLIREGAALEAGDGDVLARHIRGLLTYPHVARRMGEAALAYAERQGAALDRAVARLEPLLPA
ncbi:3-deoxy-D-manno-octulosonic acid transferase [Phenylobacterium sp.]|uniref:3-deoxy-D-manno-octulosonic acid transferase n=1 Tax=Phenylobacterium sp. TaxID=1871053 RepID=UPI002F9383E2